MEERFVKSHRIKLNTSVLDGVGHCIAFLEKNKILHLRFGLLEQVECRCPSSFYQNPKVTNKQLQKNLIKSPD